MLMCMYTCFNMYCLRVYILEKICKGIAQKIVSKNASFMAALHCGHCLQSRRSRVRIPPGCKVFWSLYIALLMST
jgi:hypothetical protein